MASSLLDSKIPSLREEIEKDEKTLANKKKGLALLEKFTATVRENMSREAVLRPTGLPSEPQIESNQFSNCGHLSTAIALFLQRKPEGATQDDIQKALLRGGWEFGKYPKRDVACAVGTRRDLFIKQNGLVYLKSLRRED